jgi:4-hydroxy-tetrahydrodipicolinate synthase
VSRIEDFTRAGLGVLAGFAALPVRESAADSGAAKRMRGVFIILTTPFTAAGEIDWDDLAREALFVDRCGCQGIVWPQGSSGVANLTKAERLRGMEVLATAARGKAVALVLGVQGQDTAEMLEYARRAEALAPDAMIAMPQSAARSIDEYREYFGALARVTSRPIIVQTSGGARELAPTVDLIVELAREFPHGLQRGIGAAGRADEGRACATAAAQGRVRRVAAGWLYEMRLGLDGVITGMAIPGSDGADLVGARARDADAVRDGYSRFADAERQPADSGADLTAAEARHSRPPPRALRRRGVESPDAGSAGGRDRGDRLSLCRARAVREMNDEQGSGEPLPRPPVY